MSFFTDGSQYGNSEREYEALSKLVKPFNRMLVYVGGFRGYHVENRTILPQNGVYMSLSCGHRPVNWSTINDGGIDEALRYFTRYNTDLYTLRAELGNGIQIPEFLAGKVKAFIDENVGDLHYERFGAINKVDHHVFRVMGDIEELVELQIGERQSGYEFNYSAFDEDKLKRPRVAKENIISKMAFGRRSIDKMRKIEGLTKERKWFMPEILAPLDLSELYKYLREEQFDAFLIFGVDPSRIQVLRNVLKSLSHNINPITRMIVLPHNDKYGSHAPYLEMIGGIDGTFESFVSDLRSRAALTRTILRSGKGDPVKLEANAKMYEAMHKELSGPRGYQNLIVEKNMLRLFTDLLMVLKWEQENLVGSQGTEALLETRWYHKYIQSVYLESERNIQLGYKNFTKEIFFSMGVGLFDWYRSVNGDYRPCDPKKMVQVYGKGFPYNLQTVILAFMTFIRENATFFEMFNKSLSRHGSPLSLPVIVSIKKDVSELVVNVNLYPTTRIPDIRDMVVTRSKIDNSGDLINFEQWANAFPEEDFAEQFGMSGMHKFYPKRTGDVALDERGTYHRDKEFIENIPKLKERVGLSGGRKLGQYSNFLFKFT